MESRDVLAVLECLSESQLTVWVDGGWGVDALVGRQTRTHEDLDLVIAAQNCPTAQEVLAGLGYEYDPAAEPGLPARLVLRGSGWRQVDLHRVVFDARGDGWQPLGTAAWTAYPADGLTGLGAIAGRRMRCVTPELQLCHHVGYPPDEADRHDMRLLSEHFGLGLPPDMEAASQAGA